LYGEIFFRSPEKTADNSTTGQNNQTASIAPTRNRQFRPENKGVAGCGPTPARGSLTNKAALRKEYGADRTNLSQWFQDAIQLRRYSPATLKIYTGWTRKFRMFTRSKNPDLLTIEDFKKCQKIPDKPGKSIGAGALNRRLNIRSSGKASTKIIACTNCRNRVLYQYGTIPA